MLDGTFFEKQPPMEADTIHYQAGCARRLQKSDMKVKEGFRLRPLGKEYIITGEGVAQIDFNKMIVLNESAAFLWKGVGDGRDFTVEDLASMLVDCYGIDMDTASRDSAAIAQKWIEAGIVSE